MKRKITIYNLLILGATLLLFAGQGEARIKLVALPERGGTVIRLDNPQATLIEEERVIPLQQGVNSVDFSWKGVSIDMDSIRLTVLTHADEVTLLNVSYPPDEAALVWEIHSKEPIEVTVRISYLLSFIDRLISYTGVSDQEEQALTLKSFLVLRNFSGEDFENATVILDEGQRFEQKLENDYVELRAVGDPVKVTLVQEGE